MKVIEILPIVESLAGLGDRLKRLAKTKRRKRFGKKTKKPTDSLGRKEIQKRKRL